MLYKRGKCDFPWAYNSRCPHSKTKFGGGVHGQYPVISDEEALELWAPWIGSLFDPNNAILFLWAVWPKMPFCLKFLEAAGFEFATCGFVWVKTTKNGAIRVNPGYYTGSNEEPCLIGVRGSMPPKKKMTRQVHLHPLLRHSEKPTLFKDLMDAMYPPEDFGMGLGLFEREPQGPGWHVFGNEVESDIPGPDFRQTKLALKVC